MPEPRHSIPQPVLRQPTASERVVRTAGLKFILPCLWAEGQVLDAESAEFINAAWHTTVINRFNASGIRDAVLATTNPTYEALDAELQAFFETYVRRPHPPRDPNPPAERSEEDRALEAWARPIFNAVASGKFAARKDYEAAFRAWFNENQTALARKREQDEAEDAERRANLARLLGLSH